MAAIEKWRQDGVPDNPAAWLHTTARYLAVDRIRRRDTHRSKVRLVAATSPQVVEDELTELVDGDLDTAEELAQDTFVAAIEKWRKDGVPDNPAAWLHTTARYLAVDRIRRRDTDRNKVRLVAATSPQAVEYDAELVEDDLADDLLGLIFMAAHPILSPVRARPSR